jgi:hypothetical protein
MYYKKVGKFPGSDLFSTLFGRGLRILLHREIEFAGDDPARATSSGFLLSSPFINDLQKWILCRPAKCFREQNEASGAKARQRVPLRGVSGCSMVSVLMSVYRRRLKTPSGW